MIIEQKALDNSFGLPIGISPEETVYFDIETTGFSADVTALYLIGCIYFKEGEWQLIQWFAEDKNAEKEALSAFSDFIKDTLFAIMEPPLTCHISRKNMKNTVSPLRLISMRLLTSIGCFLPTGSFLD